MKHYLRVVMRHPRPGRFLAARLLMASGACRLFTIRQHGFAVRFIRAPRSFRTPAATT